MTNLKPEKLLPCPFCGGEATLRESKSEHDPTGYQVVCNCGACVTTWIFQRDEAIKAWNTRSQVKTLDEEEIKKIILSKFAVHHKEGGATALYVSEESTKAISQLALPKTWDRDTVKEKIDFYCGDNITELCAEFLTTAICNLAIKKESEG